MKKPFWLHALFPTHCPFCETVLYRDQQCCEDCMQKLPSWLYRKPIPPMPYLNRVEALYHYQDGICKAISLLKFHADYDTALLLGEALGRMVKTRYRDEAIDCIIPVPLSKKKQRLRGYNQSAWLAEQVQKFTQYPLFQTVLVKNKHTEDQHLQTKDERAENLVGAFAVQNCSAIQNKTILLVDDVYTSGYTCSLCAKALLEAGAKAVVVAVVAKA